MLLNTIVALIVDSFSARRRESEARLHNLESETFISCLDRKRIDAVCQRQGINDGFHYHEEYKQPKWDYMAFIFHLEEKNPQDYTGPESMIASKIRHADVSWMPLGQSKILDQYDAHAAEVDTLSRIEQHHIEISKELEVGGHVRQNILTTMTSVSRMLDERMGTVHEQMDRLVSDVAEAKNSMTASRSAAGALASLGVGRLRSGVSGVF